MFSRHLFAVHILFCFAIFARLSCSQATTTNSTSLIASPSATSTSFPMSDRNHIYLRTTAAAPDPLGISLVSGFYGPGAWAGWFLAVMASYVRLHTEPYAKIDPNTWLFLLGNNWASVDFLRHIHILSDAGRSETEKEKGAGMIAASLSIIYWGLWFALIQLFVVVNIGSERKKPLTQRLLTVLVGSLLPGISTATALYHLSYREEYPKGFLGDVPAESIPFLYFWGMDFRDVFITTALLVDLLIFLGFVIALGHFAAQHCYGHYKPFRKFADDLYKYETALMVTYIAVGVACVVPSCLFAFFKTWRYVWILVIAVYALPFSIVLLLFAWFFHSIWMMLMALMYVLTFPVMGFKVTYSYSCFFMPCAPQSIMEWDQLYSLVVGLVLLFGIEVTPGVIEWKKKRKEFEEEMRKKMEEGLDKRRAKEARRESVDITSLRSRGMGSDDIEMGSFTLDGNDNEDDDDEPDAPLEFGTLEQAMLYEAFAASEEEVSMFGHMTGVSSLHADDGINLMSGGRSGLPQDDSVEDERYMMSGGRSGFPRTINRIVRDV